MSREKNLRLKDIKKSDTEFTQSVYDRLLGYIVDVEKTPGHETKQNKVC